MFTFEVLENRTLLSVAADDQVATIQVVPNDPMYASPSPGLWGMNKIQAPLAWNTTTGSSTVVVANIDTGIDYTHPDLYLNVWINQGEIPTSILTNLVDVDSDSLITFWDLNNSANANYVEDLNHNNYIDAGDILQPLSLGGWEDNIDGADNWSFKDDLIGWDFYNNDNDPYDDNGHGTHTAGTIGAIGNNTAGVAGVNWNVQIMALKFLGADGSGSFDDAASSIRYAADLGAKVSNNSWGGSGGYTGDVVYNAIAYAQTKNHLVIAAAGNSGFNIDNFLFRSYPAGYSLSNIISVTATDINDGRPSWANYGKTYVDLGAPGVNILSTVPGGYAFYSGTSMATPHVTGAVALLLAKDPTLSWSQLKDLILKNVDRVSSLNKKTVTGGRLNLYKALNASSTTTDTGTKRPKNSAFSTTPVAASAAWWDEVLSTKAHALFV